MIRGAARPYRTRDHFRRVDTKRQAFNLLRANPAGAVARRYKLFRPTATYFIDRQWSFGAAAWGEARDGG